VQSKVSTSNNQFCSICESWLKPFAFSQGSPICKACTDVYSQIGSWNDPTYSTPLSGYIHLFIAIRESALQDDAIDEFDSYWIDQFTDVWTALSYATRHESDYKISLK